MPGDDLTTASTVMCPHGGQAILLTANGQVFAGGQPILLQSDLHMIVGCPFTIGSKYSPCIRVQWSGGTAQVSINGTPLLTRTSVGQCFNAEGAPQGVAIIAATQPRVSAS